ncbi:MAG TPA: DUF4157 domain-containing protein [Acidimicrobiales bacterium]|nr:DUF4157 domain-containing protein [Acidimicrobiales bacterium]
MTTLDSHARGEDRDDDRSYKSVDRAPRGRPPVDTGRALQALVAGRSASMGHDTVLHVQRAVGNRGMSDVLGEQVATLDGGGSPLPRPVQAQMERAMGADLSNVRVHTDSRADELSRSMGAAAFTTGRNIAFKSGAYQPGTPGGDKLLAHELTHVVQQRSGPVEGTPTGGGVKVSDPSDRHEQEAERAAEQVAQRAVDEDEDEEDA